MCVCVCVCLFSIEIQTAGRIGTKFGTEVVLEGGKVLGFFLTQYTPPPVYGVRKGGTGCLWSLNRAFWRKLYKTKVAGQPQLSGGRSPYRTPHLEGPGLSVTHFQGDFIK